LDPSRLHMDLDADEGMVFLRTGDDPSFLGRLWVDAHHPCIRFEAEAETPFTAEARLLLCRPHRRVVPNTHVRAWDFTESVGFLMAAPKPYLDGYPVEPDHLCDDGANTLVWYHRNPYSWLSWHGTGWENHRAHDRYVDRTFGGCITGNAWQRVAPDTLRMNAPARRTSFDTASKNIATFTELFFNHVHRIPSGAEVDAVTAKILELQNAGHIQGFTSDQLQISIMKALTGEDWETAKLLVEAARLINAAGDESKAKS